MLVAVVSNSDNIEAVKVAMDELGGQIVLKKVVRKESEDDLKNIDLKNILDKIKRIYIDLLVIDVTEFPENQVCQELKHYRMIKEKTRIVIISPGATQGDILLGKLVSMGIYDIVVATEAREMTEEIITLLGSAPSMANAWKWYKEESQGNARQEELIKGNKILRWTSQLMVNAKKDNNSTQRAKKASKKEMKGIETNNGNQIGSDEVLVVDQGVKKLITLYSPVPTGKTFVGINLAITIARAGQKVAYMDCTAACAVKLHFNAEVFPFKLKSLPLWVSGFSQNLFQEDMIVILETNTDNFLNLVKHRDNSKIYGVVNSNYAHQIQLAKSIEGKDVGALIWNEYDAAVDPRDIITLPVITAIPHYDDTNARIKKGVPRALEDDELAENLLRIYNFNLARNFLNGGEEVVAGNDKKEVPAWLRREGNSD